MKQVAWRGRTGGGKLGQKALIILLKVVPIRFIYLILTVIIPFYLLFARKGRVAIYSYFREKLGYSIGKSLIKTYKNHYLFGQTIIDKFAVFAGKGDWFRAEITGEEMFTRAIDESKGLIIASSHVGNFEMAGYILRQEKKKIYGITYGNEARIMQENRDRSLSKNNVTLIPVSEDMSHIYIISQALQNGDVVNIPCDRFYTGNKRLTRSFLSYEADFPTGAYHLAEKYDVNFISAFAVKHSARKYHIYIFPIVPQGESKSERVNSMCNKFIDDLEQIVREYPEQWFNFYNFWRDGKE